MAEVPPGPSVLSPPPPADISPFPGAGVALSGSCTPGEEAPVAGRFGHDSDRAGKKDFKADGGEAETVKGHHLLHHHLHHNHHRNSHQLNGLISPELRHLKAASLKAKFVTRGDCLNDDAKAARAPEKTKSRGGGAVQPGDSPDNSSMKPAQHDRTASGDSGLAASNGLERLRDGQPAALAASLAACSLSGSQTNDRAQPDEDTTIRYVRYESELQMPDIMRLITKDLSEPYSIYTYRYFIHNWPQLCFLAMVNEECVGAIVCKLDMHKKMFRRGYIAMLAVDSKYRRKGIGTNLVKKAIYAMVEGDCDEVVLETEITNKSALKLYENLGFVRDKRLFRYYLNGVDALRLKLWLR
uniref:N-alpha-acetyltransferase 30 n=1 Tax=Geotrypetes seraphini TaxID=260995 RepID=A0A6P8RS19_GEOSA|nr:N-alpha-acetyltransferase 30 [Geotrypetes seraphini]